MRTIFIVTHKPHKFWGESCIKGEDVDKQYLDGIFASEESSKNFVESQDKGDAFYYTTEVVIKKKELLKVQS